MTVSLAVTHRGDQGVTMFVIPRIGYAAAPRAIFAVHDDDMVPKTRDRAERLTLTQVADPRALGVLTSCLFLLLGPTKPLSTIGRHFANSICQRTSVSCTFAFAFGFTKSNWPPPPFRWAQQA